MNTALKSVFDAPVILNIFSYVPLGNFKLETLFGFTHIYGTKRYITYGRGPKAVLCISPAVAGRRGGGTGGTGTGSKNCLHQNC